MTEKKLKILCLHGSQQNAETFRQKMGALRKHLKKYSELDYITSPHRIDDGTGSEEQYEWMLRTNDLKELPVYKGIEESIALLETTLLENGPYDGILGFSQGAIILSILCILQHRGELKGRFKFAIMIAGSKSRSISHRNYYTEKVSLPTLHMFGETDNIIPKDWSEDLLTVFIDPQVIIHPGGHYIPGSGSVKQGFVRFLESFLSDSSTIGSSS